MTTSFAHSPNSVATKKKSLLNYEITKKKVKRKNLAAFSRQLSVFVEAGVPMMQALTTIARETDDKVLARVLLEVMADVMRGDSMSDSLSRYPEAFPAFYTTMLSSAEQTGDLGTTLMQLSDYIGREVKAKSKVTSALIYPSIVAVMGVLCIVVLSTYVLPKFIPFFESFNAKLPLPTMMLMHVSSFLATWGVKGIIGIALVLSVLWFAKRTRRGTWVFHTMVLHLPIVGPISEAAILERVCRVFAAMLRAGVDLPRTMRTVSSASRNVVYRRAIDHALDEVMFGVGLADTIEETGLFRGTAQQMFRIGEDTGTLDRQLESAADYYSDEMSTKLDRATALFEPAIIIVVGICVGFVALAMISAMYGIYAQVKVN